MGGMMGGGGGGGGGAVNVFQPPAQSEVAAAMGRLAGPLENAAGNAGIGTPAGQNYPTALNFVNRFLTGQGGYGGTFDELTNRALYPALTAADYSAHNLYPRGTAQGDVLNQLGVGGIPYATQALQQGFDPRYGLDTPAFQHAMAGANEAATMGGSGSYGLSRMGQGIEGLINPMITAGFDPQSALYGRSRDQLMDRTGAINAMSGLGGTPYGASVQNNALSNFDIDWQNKQLARQTQAAEAARGAAGTAGSLYQAAPSLAASSAALPNQAILGQLNARNAGATSGISGYNALSDEIARMFSGAQGAGTQAAQTAMQFGAAPYNIGQGMAQNALTGLQGATNLGQQQYGLPTQLLQSFQNYLTGGQNAAGLQNQLANQQFNQQAQGFGGLMSGLGMGFNALNTAPAAGSMLARAGTALAKSDRRLKTGIKRVGTLDNGLPVYLFRYNDAPGAVHMGLMADDVERLRPDAVVEGEDGFKSVYYDRAVL